MVKELVPIPSKVEINPLIFAYVFALNEPRLFGEHQQMLHKFSAIGIIRILWEQFV